MLKNTLLRQLALGISVMLGMTATVLAQSTNGSIRGTVLDPSGALIPHAQVTISNAFGFSRTIKSNATGAFELVHLAPGSYSVGIDANGFSPALDGGVKITSGKITRENITLGISVYQEIEVSATGETSSSPQNGTSDPSTNNR